MRGDISNFLYGGSKVSYELKGMPNCPWCNADSGYVHKRRAFKDKRRKGIIVKRTLETGFK